MPEKIEISYKTFIFIILSALAIWGLYLIRNIVFIVFIAFILVSALHPLLEKMEKRKIPRSLAIILIFILLFVLFGLVIYVIVPLLAKQSMELLGLIPGFISSLKIFGDGSQLVTLLLSKSASLPRNLIKLSGDIFNDVIAFFGFLVITFYMLKERKHLERYLTSVFGNEKGSEILVIVNKVEKKLGNWVRGELLLMLFVGSLNYLGFRILGLQFALPLAVIAFFLELLPTLGPIIAGIIAVALALTVSPLLALLTAGWAFFVQQIENSLLVPKIMKASVGINPIISILSLSIGYAVAGVGGAIISLPVFLTLQVIFTKFFNSRFIRK